MMRCPICGGTGFVKGPEGTRKVPCVCLLRQKQGGKR